MELPQLPAIGQFNMNGNWNEQRKMLKSHFSQLTNEDLKFEFGKESELLHRVEDRLNIRRFDALSILENIQSECN